MATTITVQPNIMAVEDVQYLLGLWKTEGSPEFELTRCTHLDSFRSRSMPSESLFYILESILEIIPADLKRIRRIRILKTTRSRRVGLNPWGSDPTVIPLTPIIYHNGINFSSVDESHLLKVKCEFYAASAAYFGHAANAIEGAVLVFD